MRIDAAPWRKGDPPPAWPFAGLGLILLAGLGWVVSRIPPRFIPPCGFHVVTGHPCPTCGATRASLLLLRGQIADAFHTNPLLVAVVGALVFWVVAGAAAYLLGRRLTLRFGQRERLWWWILLLVVFLANWWYLWQAGI